MLQEEGTRLQALCPGDNAAQIALQQQALKEAWAALQEASEETTKILAQHLELQQFLTEVSSYSFIIFRVQDSCKVLTIDIDIWCGGQG